MAGPEPLLTDFGIHARLESSVHKLLKRSNFSTVSRGNLRFQQLISSDSFKALFRYFLGGFIFNSTFLLCSGENSHRCQWPFLS